MTRCLRRYATFSGRSRRSEYWWFSLLYAAVIVTGVLVDALTTGTALEGLGGVIVITCFLTLGLPLLAVSIRRLHDTGRSGWWYLSVLIPAFGGFLLLLFLAERTTPVANQYGLSPKPVAVPSVALHP